MRPGIRYELEGWELFGAALVRADDSATAAAADRIAALRAEVTATVQRDFVLDQLASHPTVKALRELFKAAGTNPSRYRPSSEALVRRLLKGSEMPAIDALVDLNNCLSASLAVPCCVMAEGTFEPPFVLRSGRDGESYESLRGPFRLAGRPLLVDTLGPCDAPITGSTRVKVTADSQRAWLIAYLPHGLVSRQQAAEVLEHLIERAPVAACRLIDFEDES